MHLSNITYEVAGRPLFRQLSYVFGRKKYGLVGANGAGKTTLLRILAGELAPDEGHARADGRVGYLRQRETPPPLTVGEYLEGVWEADRLAGELVARIPFERRLTELSGGEWVRARFARLLIEGAEFILLDEPTNDLDRAGRAAVAEFTRAFRGGMIIVSHDRELLEHVDAVVELSGQGIATYGGSFDHYARAREDERARQGEELERAKKEERRRRQERTVKKAKQEKRMRHGEKVGPDLGIPKIILGAMKRNAQETQAKLKVREDAFVERADQARQDAWETMKIDPFVRFDFEAARPAAGRRHFNVRAVEAAIGERRLWARPLSFVVKGEERWHIRGGNGSGKSTLLGIILGKTPLHARVSGEIERGDRIAYLDQKYGALDPERSLIENLEEGTRFDPIALRNELAFFGFHGEAPLRPVKTFSGGELLKAALARALLGLALPEVIVLDEPTNNLDLASQELLARALAAFRGALVLVSHDGRFVEQLGIKHVIDLEEELPDARG